MTPESPALKNIIIIGFGLIGSSIARAVKGKDPSIKITAIDCNRDYLQYAVDKKIADVAYDEYDHYLSEADLIILCTPIGQMGNVAQAIAPYLLKHIVVTDVGSVKQSVVENVTDKLPYPEMFVPGHPISGAETSGPESYANRAN
jgi:cyclohexadieny/prephenate dehydrogenase